MLLKNLFLLKRSFPRLFNLFYWVTIELLFWGFITLWFRSFLSGNQGVDLVIALLTGLIFWDMFLRSQHSLTISFLEDVWSRNLINIFASPLGLSELVISLVLLSIIQVLIAFFYVSLLAFLLYSLKIWAVGFYIIPFFLNIFLFGWALGLFTVGIIIRFGPSAEILAWSIPFLLLPFSAVYYPLSILPAVVQKIAFFLPTMHLFEGMRAVLINNNFPVNDLFWATILNIVYFSLGVLFLYLMLRTAKKKGLIARLLTD